MLAVTEDELVDAECGLQTEISRRYCGRRRVRVSEARYTHGNSLGACTRADVGEMRSDCPERATHNILRRCKACRRAMENPGLSQISSSHGLYNVGEEMKPLGG